MDTYNYPINLADLMNAKKLPRISIEESVRRHMYIILMTNFGESRFNREYGCSLWFHDFDISVNDSSWASAMEETLRKNIVNNEPRIQQDFKISIRIEKASDEGKDLRRKFMIDISNLVLRETNERVRDVEYLIIFSPITIK